MVACAVAFVVVLGHNAVYIAVGFAWLRFADDGEATMRPNDGASAYQMAAMLCFFIFADNLLGRIEGTAETSWLGLRSSWVLIVASGVLSLICQLLFWTTLIPEEGRRTWDEWDQNERPISSQRVDFTASMSLLTLQAHLESPRSKVFIGLS